MADRELRGIVIDAPEGKRRVRFITREIGSRGYTTEEIEADWPDDEGELDRMIAEHLGRLKLVPKFSGSGGRWTLRLSDIT